MRKLIALDLDGTTLTSQITVSPRTKRALKAAEACGHIVCIVTGRPNRIAEHIYDQLELTSPMINFNGGLGYVPHHAWSGENQRTIPQEIVWQIVAQKAALGIQVIAAEGKEFVLADRDVPIYQDFFPTNLSEDQFLTTANLTADPVSLTMYVDAAKKFAIQAALTRQFSDIVQVDVWGGPTPILEVAPKGVNKAWGVDYLAQRVGIAPENVIAFGDEHNDMEMIAHAGWGVAMKNGIEPLKAVADDVTSADNDHDGLAQYLEQYLDLPE